MEDEEEVNQAQLGETLTRRDGNDCRRNGSPDWARYCIERNGNATRTTTLSPHSIEFDRHDAYGLHGTIPAPWRHGSRRSMTREDGRTNRVLTLHIIEKKAPTLPKDSIWDHQMENCDLLYNLTDKGYEGSTWKNRLASGDGSRHRCLALEQETWHQQPKGHVRRKSNPSAPHLTWCCTETREFRTVENANESSRGEIVGRDDNTQAFAIAGARRSTRGIEQPSKSNQ